MMNNDFESKFKSAAEKAKPLLEALLADLDREATLIKERDLDPRKLADEPKVQEAKSAAVEALENLTAFAKSLDSLVKSYAPEFEKKIDVDAIREQLAAAPGIARSRFEAADGHDVAEKLKATSEEARVRIETTAQDTRERIDEAADKGKEQVAAAAHKGKDSTAEMLAALGWLAAAGTVIYVVLMDEKRRRQAKSAAKAAASGLLVVANSATKKH